MQELMPEGVLGFLCDGHLGPVGLRCSMQTVRSFLGEPESTGNPRVIPTGWTLWAYAGTVLQFGFREDRLIWFGFVLVNKGIPALPAALGVGRLPFNGNTRRGEFETMLRLHAISWTSIDDSCRDVLQLRLASSVRAIFDANDHALEKVINAHWA